MSWSQDYSVPGVMSLLIELTGKHPEELLLAELAKQGITIVKREQVVLSEGMYDDVVGEKVTLSDGRVFIPKLVEQFTADGNYGLDTYQYFPEDETPNVSHTSEDHPLEYGLTDESELASDGELEFEHTCDVVDISDGPCGDPSHDR